MNACYFQRLTVFGTNAESSVQAECTLDRIKTPVRFRKQYFFQCTYQSIQEKQQTLMTDDFPPAIRQNYG